mmetsp:Transcript_6330/g.6582  ORF Transcript_6330/g.6582 Transcript_6330/m.6582 type:complete len:274 (+) Transcript_6330:1-822(+)
MAFQYNSNQQYSQNQNLADFNLLRTSLNNNLIRGDYLRALDKISDNLTNIRNNLKELRNFLINIGSKKDNKQQNEGVNHLLLITGDLFKDSMMLIKDFKEFKFPNKNDQVANLRQLRLMESKCSDMKTEFDSLTFKITRQNKSIIESHRNSRLSFPSTMEKQEKLDIVLGNDLLLEEKLIEKEKQNDTIEKINKQLFTLSTEQNKMIFEQGNMVGAIENNVGETENNIQNAIEEITIAKDNTEGSDKLINCICIGVVILVILLFVMMLILPKA